MALESKEYSFIHSHNKDQIVEGLIQLYEKDKEIHYMGELENGVDVYNAYVFYNTAMLLGTRKIELIGHTEEIKTAKNNLEKILGLRLTE